MAKKQNIKQSEQRILLYLNQVPIQKAYSAKIASKLEIGYSYLIQLLNSMRDKDWVSKERGLSTNKSFYKLTKLGQTIVGGIKE